MKNYFLIIDAEEFEDFSRKGKTQKLIISMKKYCKESRVKADKAINNEYYLLKKIILFGDCLHEKYICSGCYCFI